MSNSYANKQPKYSRYVVKNLSNKQVRIFGINIKPGVEFDLLSIPGISQNEIFSSVLKDDIGPRLRSTPPILTVTENTIDLITITLPDADYTLDPVYFDFGTIIFAGTLTAQRNIIFPNYGSTDNNWIVRNNTNQFLNVKTLSGTGSLIQSGLSEVVFSDGANIQGLAANSSDTNTVGGFRSVADITARNAIATQLRKEGMYVYVQSSNEIYKLGSGLTNSDWLYAHDNSSVTNLAALVALNDAEYTERTEFTVLTLKDVFYLDKTSTATANGITILNSLSSSSGVSAGRWIRKPIHDPQWLLQATWFIDPVSGNDEASGLTSLLPLKTWAEFINRVGMNPYITGQMVITLSAGTFSGTDPIIWQPIGGPNAFINIVGTLTVMSTGTITAVTARNPATNTPLSITDTSHSSWASDVARLITITAGTPGNIGASAWVAKDLGANSCRLSSLMVSNIASFSPEVVPVIGDSYAVYTSTGITTLDIHVSRPAAQTATTQCFLLEKVTLLNISNRRHKLISDSSDGSLCQHVKIQAFTYLSYALMRNCCAHTSVGFGGLAFELGVNYIDGGVFIGTSAFAGASKLSLRYGFLMQGPGFTYMGSVLGEGLLDIQDVGIMDWGNVIPYCILIGDGTVGMGIATGGSAGKLWGSTATASTFVANITKGRLYIQDPTFVTIAGALTATQDFKVNGRTTLPPFDYAASPPQFKAVINNTWANLNLAVASGGFGGDAINPATSDGVTTAR